MIHNTPKVIMIDYKPLRSMHAYPGTVLRTLVGDRLGSFTRPARQLAYGILANRRNNLRYQVREA
jgi:hypothetical protein